MNVEIRKGQLWRNASENTVHVSTEISSDGITTWGRPLAHGQEGIAGYSWFGPLDQFIKEFLIENPTSIWK